MGRKADSNRLEEIARYVERHPRCKPIEIARELDLHPSTVTPRCRRWKRPASRSARTVAGGCSFSGNVTDELRPISCYFAKLDSIIC